MMDESLLKRLENITDFVNFEAETSAIWPWAVPAEELLRSEEGLRTAAQAIRLDAEGRCDTDEMYEALDQVFGLNPILMPEEGMLTPEM